MAEEAVVPRTSSLQPLSLEWALAKASQTSQRLLNVGSAALLGTGVLGTVASGTVIGVTNVFNLGWGRLFPALEVSLNPRWYEGSVFSLGALLVGAGVQYGLDRVYHR